MPPGTSAYSGISFQAVAETHSTPRDAVLPISTVQFFTQGLLM